MGTNRPAAGGGRDIFVAPERLGKWIDGFDVRHRVTSMTPTEHGLRAEAADTAVAVCALPLGRSLPPGAPPIGPDGEWGSLLEYVIEHASAPLRVGVVMARRAALAVGVFDGPRLESSKVDTSYVQGRTAAGGWSQQRYARRRSNQAKAAAQKAADVVNRLIAPVLDTLDAVVTAGDKDAVAMILEDPRLAEVEKRVIAPHLGDVPEPRRATLEALPELYRSVHIHLTQPEGT
ncbi:acVLRF1 family peptidyl-tRNA hydrolase [Stackebrandtia soli]|uniref:acVLRF1 family peptidyl-tRNA hydrolase n=1 Tax=Stackebrandtia soli TaxID=1892856 RepID=UPI0039E85A38